MSKSYYYKKREKVGKGVLLYIWDASKACRPTLLTQFNFKEINFVKETKICKGLNLLKEKYKMTNETCPASLITKVR